MSSISNLLNPEEQSPVASRAPSENEKTLSPGRVSSSPAGSTMSGKTSTNVEHAPHPDCPDTLDCLPDAEGRPQHTLPVILRCAILGSPKKRLTIREIYAAMEDKYPYYKTAGPTWKQSVRHHLSLNRLFERQPRPVTDPGFGSYWTVNLEAPPGTKRPRKRGRTTRDANDDDSAAAPAKKRGRPRKAVAAESEPAEMHTHTPPRLQLRLPARPEPPSPSPPLHPYESDDAHSVNGMSHMRPLNPRVRACQISALRAGHDIDGEESDTEMLMMDDGQGLDDDDFESEEDMVYPFQHTMSISRTQPQPQSQPGSSTVWRFIPGRVDGGSNVSHGAGPSTRQDGGGSGRGRGGSGGSPYETIDRLRIEIEGLKRQTSDAAGASMRVSDQLAAVQAEASRAKAALRAAEAMLEEESRKRREAERAAMDAERRRREVEEELRRRGRSLSMSRSLSGSISSCSD